MPTRGVPADRMSSVATLVALARQGEAHRHWYTEGLPAVHAVADALGVSPDVLADVIALTSPRVSVRRNMVLAVAYLNGRERYQAMDARTLARSLGVIHATAAALLHWEATGRIRGPKTRAFALAVQGDPDALVLDIWMSRALGIPQERLFRRNNLRKATARLQTVARRLGWTVAETQAAIWAGVIPTWRKADGGRVYLDAPPLRELLLEAA